MWTKNSKLSLKLLKRIKNDINKNVKAGVDKNKDKPVPNKPANRQKEINQNLQKDFSTKQNGGLLVSSKLLKKI